MRLRPWLLLAVSAVLMFLGFAGFGIWPLAFVGIVPALFVFDPQQTIGGFERPGGRPMFWRAMFFGYVAELGGFYWLIHTLVTFSGFPIVVCLLFASIFYLFQGLQFVAIVALWARARSRGFAATPALVAAYVAIEAAFPMLFEHYYGSSLHPVPVLMQIADLGGPMTCTALLMTVAGAVYEVVFAIVNRRRIPRLWPAIAIAALAFALIYGSVRIGQSEARAASAPALQMGVVQANMGLFEKWDDPVEGVRRHVEQTRALVRRAPVERPLDLVIWPESAVTYFVPSGIEDLDDWRMSRRLGLSPLDVPLLFGSLRHAPGEDRELDRNTAFLADRDGRLLGHYDKRYLLAFGEFLPFGDTFPVLYDISPMSGRFTPGDDTTPLRYVARDGGAYRFGILICYEDIVSAFVRNVVVEGDPHVLLNLTNDSWFGDTQEPWVHLTLARFRAIEHRRYLVRATNSGVSAIIDNAGRIVAQSRVFERDELEGSIPMIAGERTLYQQVGAWPGWVGLIAILAMGFWPRRPRGSMP